MLQVTDKWTTQDGSWVVDASKPYGIGGAVMRYEGGDIPGSGGDHHIFVRTRESDLVEFFTATNNTTENYTSYVADHTGWVNHPLFQSSSYKPSLGEHGPWVVTVNGVEVANGLGLPNGWHVSTFLVVEDVEDVPVPEQPPVDGKHLQVLVDGVVVLDRWV